MGVLYRPPARHRHCDLPDWQENTGAADTRRGTVVECDNPACKKAWVFDPIPWERTWRPLLPWPFDREARNALRAKGLLS